MGAATQPRQSAEAVARPGKSAAPRRIIPSSQQVIRRDAGEYHGAEPLVVEGSPEQVGLSRWRISSCKDGGGSVFAER